MLWLQLSGGTFPTGGFNHSYGLETYLQTDAVKNSKDLEEFLNVQLDVLCNSDVIFLKESFQAMNKNDDVYLVQLQDYYSALKVETEIVQASLKTGRSFLNGILPLFSGDVHRALEKLDHLGIRQFPIVYGATSAILSLPLEETIDTYLYSSLSNLVHVATRIMPLGQTEAQKLIRMLQNNIMNIYLDYQQLTLDDVSVFSPGLQLASMKHETLFSRLCMS